MSPFSDPAPRKVPDTFSFPGCNSAKQHAGEADRSVPSLKLKVPLVESVKGNLETYGIFFVFEDGSYLYYQPADHKTRIGHVSETTMRQLNLFSKSQGLARDEMGVAVYEYNMAQPYADRPEAIDELVAPFFPNARSLGIDPQTGH